MLKTIASGLALTFARAGPTSAQESGTAEDVKAVLDHVVETMNADAAGTIDLINAQDPSVVEADIYPFCGGPDGMFTAHGADESLVGTALQNLEDKAGTALGQDIDANAAAGRTAEVAYMWPRPGETEPTDMVGQVTKIGDRVGAVGYDE